MEIAIRTEVTPASIVTNFEEVRKHLETELAKYDVVVTADTLSDCKKLATQINKLRGEIDSRRKEEVAKASEPVRQFDERMKELVDMCKSGRQRLLDQIKQFDDQQIAKATELAEDYLSLQVVNAGLRDEFSNISAPAQKISNLTPSGNLTAAAKAEIDDLVSAQSLLQSRTDKRLTDLELECRRAGMEHPLERSHIEAFLMADDEVYQSRLDGMIKAELDRIERIKQAEQAKAEAEKARMEAEAVRREQAAAAKAAQEERQRIEAEQREQQRIASEQQPEAQPVQPEPQADASIVRIQATFEVELTDELKSKGVTPEQLLKAFESKLVKNGFGNSFSGARLV